MAEQYILSFLYYLLLAAAAAGAAGLAFRFKKGRLPLYLLSFAVLFFPTFLTPNGVDRDTYVIIFQTARWRDVFSLGGQEPGFMLFNILLRVFGTSRYIPLFAMHFVTIGLVYTVAYFYRRTVSVPLAIFIYALLYNVQSQNLIRIYMAGSILLLATHFLYRRRTAFCIVAALAAFSIHYSAIAYFFVLILYLLLRNARTSFGGKIILSALACLVAFAAILLGIPFAKSFKLFARYLVYFENIRFDNIGILQLAYYLPVLLLLYQAVKHRADTRFALVTLSVLMTAFLFAMLSYGIPNVSRMASLFFQPFVLFLPLAYKKAADGDFAAVSGEGRLYRSLVREKKVYSVVLRVAIVVYTLARFIIYFQLYAVLDGVLLG